MLNVGELAWRLENSDWPGAWVLILTKENMWYLDKNDDYREKPGRPGQEQFYCYEVLCPDGSVARYTDAVLRNRKEERRNMMLRFNDGIEIDTSGPLRMIRLEDGLYVVGTGWCIPVEDTEEAETIIEKFKGVQDEGN